MNIYIECPRFCLKYVYILDAFPDVIDFTNQMKVLQPQIKLWQTKLKELVVINTLIFSSTFKFRYGEQVHQSFFHSIEKFTTNIK